MAETATKLPVKTERAPEVPSLSRRFGHFESSLQGLRHEMDRLFEHFAGRALFKSPTRSLFDFEPSLPSDIMFTHGLPAVDVAERDGEYEIVAEMPGLGEKEIEVKISEDVLTITGEKKDFREERDKNYHLMERRAGSISRSFELPKGVDRNRIEATLSKGVLTLRLPKTAESVAQAKRIDVKAA